MLTYTLRRILYSIPVLLVATFMLFWLVRVAYDPCTKLRSTKEGAAAVQRCEKNFGLDKPVPVQYANWLTDALKGDLGTSSRTGQPVSEMLPSAMWNTVQLMFFGTVLSIFLALFLGVFSAVRQYSPADYTFTALAFIGIAMPPFWFGLLATSTSPSARRTGSTSRSRSSTSSGSTRRARPASTWTTCATSHCRC